MKISEALNKLKNLKSEAKKVDEYITESLVHFEDETPDYNYESELSRRTELQDQIDDLKTRVQITNATTVVETGGRPHTLAELILKNASLRADLAFYTKLLETKIEYGHRYMAEQRTKDTVRKVYAEGYSKESIREYIQELQGRKETVDSLIAQTNLTTELAEA